MIKPVFERQRLHPLHTLVLTLLLVVLLGFLLQIGQKILLPIFAAVISMYVLITLSDWLGRLPIVGRTPEWLRRLLVLAAFVGVVAGLASIVITTGEKMVATAPMYQANLERMVASVTAFFGISQDPDWQAIRDATIGRVSMQSLFGSILGSVGSMAGMVVLVVVYALFLTSERGRFASKLAIALPGDSATQTKQMVSDINRRIGDYLAVKTLVNIILALISLAILWLCGVDYALFWAVTIGLLNYIPYVGSLLAVVFPVLLTLAQFGSIQTTLLVAGLLTVAQMFVGNVLEPKVIGKQVNLSPFVVLVSLSLWSSLWGIAGAILAIPLTSILVIVLAAFPASRPLAILLVDDASAYASESLAVAKAGKSAKADDVR